MARGAGERVVARLCAAAAGIDGGIALGGAQEAEERKAAGVAGRQAHLSLSLVSKDLSARSRGWEGAHKEQSRRGGMGTQGRYRKKGTPS